MAGRFHKNQAKGLRMICRLKISSYLCSPYGSCLSEGTSETSSAESESGRVVIGSQARLRIWCRKAYGFESLRPHKISSGSPDIPKAMNGNEGSMGNEHSVFQY